MASADSVRGRVKQQLPDDLSNVEFETSEDVEVIPSFDSLALREDLLRGIYAYGTIDLVANRFDCLHCLDVQVSRSHQRYSSAPFGPS